MTFPVLILSSNRFSILTLRQASFDRLRTGQGERIEKHDFDRLRAEQNVIGDALKCLKDVVFVCRSW
jgi:hypothetical protein